MNKKNVFTLLLFFESKYFDETLVDDFLRHILINQLYFLFILCIIYSFFLFCNTEVV